tara:strand:+ start:5313 stop:5861 length:549 start_codon:yes stop_codon:yes gene_type:complete
MEAFTTTQDQYNPQGEFFNNELLLRGDSNQLKNWVYGHGRKSIYVQTVHHSVTEEQLKTIFQYLGDIYRIDIVKKKEGNMNMAFVHFRYWYSNAIVESHLTNITTCYPQAYDLPLCGMKPLEYLRCRINTNPIEPDVEYNNVQLTDMVDRLRRDHEALKEENEDLKKRLFNLELVMKIRSER